MRAVVTGGAGFIGSHLVERLSDDGHEVTVVDDLRSSPVELADLAWTWHDRRIRVLADAVEDHPEAPNRPDVIFHLAGPVGPVGVLAQAGRIVTGVVRLAAVVRDWALDRGIPLVYVSTSEVYGGDGGECHEGQQRVIAPGHSARMEYAVAKLAAETMLLNTDGLDVRIVRPFNVAGPRQSARGGFVTPRFIGQAVRGRPLTVYEPGTQLRAFTHVVDEVDGIVRVAARGIPGGVYNVGNPANRTTMLDYARLVIDVLGRGEISIVDPTTLHGPAFREAPDKYPAPSAEMEALGWEPAHGLADIVRDAAAYMARPGMLERLG